MKLTKTKNEVIENLNVAGLLECQIKHTIKEASASARYMGPKIPKGEWEAILAFLKWVYDTNNSEAQVRLYVNTRLGTWKAWAYPQEEGTGMSAREMETAEATAQRAQFKDSEGWLYYGTVHSHCSMSAFQSGTDEANEQSQDGLHITVGKLDQKTYDLDIRFYRRGEKFDPDLSEFWDVGAPWNTLGEWLQFVDTDSIAWNQMAQPPEKPEVPEAWMKNVIQKPRVTTPSGPIGFHRNYDAEDFGGHYWPGVHTHGQYQLGSGGEGKNKVSESIVLRDRLDRALQSLEARLSIANHAVDELEEVMAALEGPVGDIVFDICKRYDLTPEELATELAIGGTLDAMRTDEELKEAAEEAALNQRIDQRMDGL